MKINDLLNKLYGRKGYVDTDNVNEVINEIELTSKEFNELLQNEIVLHCTSNYGSNPKSYNIYTKEGLVVATIKEIKVNVGDFVNYDNGLHYGYGKIFKIIKVIDSIHENNIGEYQYLIDEGSKIITVDATEIKEVYRRSNND